MPADPHRAPAAAAQLSESEYQDAYERLVERMVPGAEMDAALRFVHLIDELYDRNVNLILSAPAGPTALYHGDRHAHAFERTASRLIEMQSEAFLAREHKA